MLLSTNDPQDWADLLYASALTGEPIELEHKTYQIPPIVLKPVAGRMPKVIGPPEGATIEIIGSEPYAGIYMDRVKTPVLPGLVLKNLRIAMPFRENVFYHGIHLWGQAQPIIENVTVENVSIGHAILFAHSTGGIVNGIAATDCSFTDDPGYIPGEHSPSRPVIHWTSCKQFDVSGVRVLRATSTAPGRDRDAVSMRSCEQMTVRKIYCNKVNTALDIGSTTDSVFEDLHAEQVDFIGVYFNNGTERCLADRVIVRLESGAYAVYLKECSQNTVNLSGAWARPSIGGPSIDVISKDVGTGKSNVVNGLVHHEAAPMPGLYCRVEGEGYLFANGQLYSNL